MSPLSDGPLSGFYLYLDDNRVSKAYYSSLDNLVLTSKRILSKSDDTIGAEVNAAHVKLDATHTTGQELETVNAPPLNTPERQAQALIKRMKDEKDPFRLTEYGSSLDHFLSPKLMEYEVKDIGVALTPDQVDKFKKWRLSQVKNYLERSRNTLFTCTGPLTFSISKLGEIRVEFKSGGYGDVICSGTLAERYLDNVLLIDMKKATNAVTIHGNLIGIVVSSVSDENLTRIEMLPCAIW